MTDMLAQTQTQPGSGFDVLGSLQSGFTQFVNYLPQLIGALLVLLIGYIIAKILNKVVTKLLQKARLDQRLDANSGGRFVEKLSPDGKPSRLVGGVIFWVIMLFVITSAIGTLGIPALTGFMNQVLSWLPNVIAALIIFVVAALVAGAIGGVVHKTMGDTPTGRVVRAAVPTLIMAIAVFMILTQLGIAQVIVTTTYIALIGALALASALAFGLGGRDAAADLVNSGYRKAQQQADQVRRDVATGQDRGHQEVQNRLDTENQGAENQGAENVGQYAERTAQQPPVQQPPVQQPPADAYNGDPRSAPAPDPGAYQGPR